MVGKSPESSASPSQLVLSRGDDEVSADPDGLQTELALAEKQAHVLKISKAELVVPRINVIALENMVISLMARSSSQQLE
jgi:hypothetical protein